MSKIRILKTNRRIKESPFLTACKEQDGLLGNIEMNHYTNVDDMLHDSPFRVDPGSNVKLYNEDYWWREISKPWWKFW